MKKLIYAVTFLFSTSAIGQIVDEVGSGTIGKPVMSDREMRNTVNLQSVQPAFDQSGAKENVLRFNYNPDVTYKLRLREYMNTTVILPSGESIAAFSLGDTSNFTFLPLANERAGKGKGLENIFKIWAKYPGADTNLTIVGKSGHIYSFYLRVDSVKSSFLPALVVYIEDALLTSSVEKSEKEKLAESKIKDETLSDVKPVRYPMVMAKGSPEEEAEYLRSISLIDPAKINYGYTFVNGDQAIAPLRVFDDGYWTYFYFAESNLDMIKRLPTIYRVVDGYDTPVNTRVVKGTVIAETTSKGWTLKNGEAHLCVRKY